MLQIILLAAGLSQRFGATNKLLHPVEGKEIFLHTLTNLSKAKLGKILLVTGLNRKEVVDQIPSHISFQEVYNPNFKSGMTSSIQAAVTASSASANGYMICLADQIKIKPKTYSLISKAYEKLYKENQQSILVPSYQSQNANPVVLSSHYRSEILQLKSTNGCKPIVLKNKSNIHILNLEDPGLVFDIDTMEDLNE